MDSEVEKEQVSIILTKGSLDWIYATLILASTAAAMGKRVDVFCSFYGVKGLYRNTSGLKVSPLANPAMILKLPVGPNWLKKIDWNKVLPQVIWIVPGMTALVTFAFKLQMKHQNQLPIEELRALCLELGVKFTACSMAFDLLGVCESDLIDEIEIAGAATYFAESPPSQSLFI
ncbi:DsrE/DsrF/DrsH-like family protein [Hydrogenovibrio sp. JE_KL2]|uniref:DsrE/DsrF/DrsH-like family protein n=1 Tax=Hydrogenovibrio sp. JE_KL2 TaxID=2651188 RepID=UPI00128D2FB7|nr:DsrE/DsrF/DrsH-like family protein [Hydrogenovibrio sp. JE_KL2]MPQ75609.1 peroxiredoxin family protein [Hydrogenovibrio sp. JE_KL2]